MSYSSTRIADITMIKMQISKQMIVTGGQVITACRVVLAYEVIVVNSWLGNCRLGDWTAVPGLGEGIWGLLLGPHTSGAPCNKSNLG